MKTLFQIEAPSYMATVADAASAADKVYGLFRDRRHPGGEKTADAVYDWCMDKSGGTKEDVKAFPFGQDKLVVKTVITGSRPSRARREN